MNSAHQRSCTFDELVDQAADLAAATETVIAACAGGGDPGGEPARVGAGLFSSYDDIRRRVRAYSEDDRVEALAELLLCAEELLGLALEHAYGTSGAPAGQAATQLGGDKELVDKFLALKSMPVRAPRS